VEWTKLRPLLLVKQGETTIKVGQKLRIATKLTKIGGVYKKRTSIGTNSPRFHQNCPYGQAYKLRKMKHEKNIKSHRKGKFACFIF